MQVVAPIRSAVPMVAAPMSRPGTELDISVVSELQAFDQLAPDWIELQSRDVSSSIFLSWDWQRLWWKHYGDDRELCIVVARMGRQVVGLLPLYVERHRRAGGLFEARKLRQIGVGGDTSPDDLGGLFVPEHEREATHAIVRYLARECRKWDMLDWSDLAPGTPLADTLQTELRAEGLRVNCVRSDPITFGRLPGCWDAYRRSLSRNRREVMSRKRRKFEALAGACCRLIEGPTEVDAAFDRLAELHRLRWSSRTERPAFSTAQYMGFHRELMRALVPHGRLCLLELELGGRSIAMLYGLRYKGRFCLFQTGFDPAYAQHSPGDVLMGYAVELAIGQGHDIFDMLKGDHEYKRHFFQDSRQNLEIRAFRRGLVDTSYRLHELLGRLRSALHEGRAAQAARHGPVVSGSGSGTTRLPLQA
jgi:CelD/BcsL family acetyltransferase involved in cellulose biosynthesis